MLVNPSIYNGLGRYNKNVDLTSLERRNGPSAMTKKGEEARIKNSLTEFINNASYKQVSSFNAQFSSDLKALNQSAKTLSNKTSDLFSSRQVTQSSSSFDVSAKSGAALGKRSFSVNALATKQTNLSESKSSTLAMSESSKDSLVIEQGTSKTTIQVEKKSGDTYESYLGRAAKAINESQNGVKASVKVDAMGYAQLSVESKEAGTNSAFKLSGSAADALKLNDQQTAAKDMSYTLDGKEGTAKSNTLTLEDGKTTITAKAVSTESQSFEVTKSSSALTSSLKSFADAFNRFVDNQSGNDNPLSKSIVKQLSGIAKRTVENIGVEGISVNDQGKIAIDESKLNASIKENPDAVEKALTRYDSLSSAIARKTDQIQSVPSFQLAPNFNQNAFPVKAFIYNYTQQSTLSNINQLTSGSSMIDIRI